MAEDRPWRWCATGNAEAGLQLLHERRGTARRATCATTSGGAPAAGWSTATWAWPRRSRRWSWTWSRRMRWWHSIVGGTMGGTCRMVWDLDSTTGCGGWWLAHLRTSPKRFSMMPAALTNSVYRNTHIADHTRRGRFINRPQHTTVNLGLLL